MGIPESQLDTWSHQGAVSQSASTYATIRGSLEAASSGYAAKDYKIFLQGSYCNDTNIYSESDVDVVIRLDSAFHHDLTALEATEKQAFDAAHSDGPYPYDQYKNDVVAQLRQSFGTAVAPGTKAVSVEASGNRRRADVLVAMQYRRYHRFRSLSDQSYSMGVCFFASGGGRIVSYPVQHSNNCTAKHQTTNQWFKPVVRIVKNLRCRLEDEGLLVKGNTPSYYLEGLLYNVPNDKFGGSFEGTLANCLNWIMAADRSQFVCVNQEYYLLRDGYKETWSPAKCEAFLSAAVTLWNQW